MTIRSYLSVAALLLFVACGSSEESAEPAVTEKKPEPDYITVQHILIGFQGSVPGKAITRSKEEAQKLAEELLKRAQGGEDFDDLVKRYTDDRHPGVYKMANHGVQVVDPSQRIFPRGRMVAAFGDVGFPLEVGEIGMAPHAEGTSPYGWHIIKRLE